MSAQQLGPKKLRKIAADVGEPILRGWSHGGYWFGFVTPDHRHGSWNVKSHQWSWDVVAGREHYPHYTSCYETWPETRGKGTHGAAAAREGKPMRVKVGVLGTSREVQWPDGWPIPREGDSVVLNPYESEVQCVRSVTWFPEGEEEDYEAFVYIVIGRRAPA